ncbi:hypothetical protein AMK16_30060 [Streptomyces sp. CB00455]|nr:hypothetical protein AMK16_30060 [Streptomyces sp. CB00455]
MVREGACEALGLFEERAAVPALTARLNDESSWVRSRAALALGQIGGDRALAALWQAMMERRNPKASHLASAIAAFGPPVVDDLIALTTDPDPDLRALACRALGSTADDRALPALERLIAHDLAKTTLRRPRGNRRQAGTADRAPHSRAHRIDLSSTLVSTDVHSEPRRST